MSTPNVPVYVRYIGNEETTEFSITFPYIDRKYVKVYLARNRINTPELLDESRYSFVNDTTIQFPVKDDDVLLGYNDALIILRKTDLGSDYDFDNQRRLFPEDVMGADDLAFHQIQELAYDVSRTIKSSIVGEETVDDLLNGIYSSRDRAESAAARAEDALDSATAFANDAESSAEQAAQSATKAEEYVSQLEDVASRLPIKFTNITVASGEWIPSTVYDDFGYEVMIHLVGVKSTHTPTVIFDVVEATSGNFAPVAISEDEAVTIFAKEQPTADIIIPVIVLE